MLLSSALSLLPKIMHMHTLLLLTTFLALTPTPTHAWGVTGHETIAWIAQRLISPATTTFVQSALGSKTHDFMANVSTWADSYRYTSGGHWSAPLHFIDANDNPPVGCGVDFNRDCGSGGCVVSAIVNYTGILAGGGSDGGRLEAMKFLIHFVGDIHQPLHDEALDKGGNGIPVTWGKTATNLHHIWDTQIVDKLAAGKTPEAWSQTLLSQVKAGAFSGSDSWTAGMSLNDTQGSAMSWASGANAFVCSDVLKGGIAAVEGGDLSGTYYTAHSQVALEQITKAGVRLGAWLDMIAGS